MNDNMKIKIEKLDRPEHSGDWHDKPLRWRVVGPGAELQKFSTKSEATLYKRLRRKAKTFAEATQAYILTA
jgi:hypothetical protein